MKKKLLTCTLAFLSVCLIASARTKQKSKNKVTTSIKIQNVIVGDVVRIRNDSFVVKKARALDKFGETDKKYGWYQMFANGDTLAMPRQQAIIRYQIRDPQKMDILKVFVGFYPHTSGPGTITEVYSFRRTRDGHYIYFQKEKFKRKLKKKHKKSSGASGGFLINRVFNIPSPWLYAQGPR